MGNFYTDVIEKSPSFHSITAIKTMDLLEPTFRAAVQAILAESALDGKPMMAFETYRSTDRQLQLFHQHLTQLKNVGVHHYGLAADLCFLDNGVPSWKGDFHYLGQLALKHNLIWGGDWGTPKAPHTFRDWDHIQFISVADQNKMFNGSWYPDSTYNALQHING